MGMGITHEQFEVREVIGLVGTYHNKTGYAE